MGPATQKPIACVLIATLATVAGVGEWPPVLDEDACSMCRTCSENQSLASAVHVTLAMPLMHDPSAVVLCDAPAATVRLFQARAPPLV